MLATPTPPCRADDDDVLCRDDVCDVNENAPAGDEEEMLAATTAAAAAVIMVRGDLSIGMLDLISLRYEIFVLTAVMMATCDSLDGWS